MSTGRGERAAAAATGQADRDAAGGPVRELPTDDQVLLAVETFRLLGDPTRLRVIAVLAGGEQSVGALAEAVGAPLTAVSQHLAKLRMARMVRARREGTFLFYSLENVHVLQLVEEALYHADHAVQGLPDHGRTRTRSKPVPED